MTNIIIEEVPLGDGRPLSNRSEHWVVNRQCPAANETNMATIERQAHTFIDNGVEILLI